jgi:hypothetical protein
MARAFVNVLMATLMMVGLALFFVGFVLAPLIVLAVGYVLFTFAAGDR